MKTKRKTTLKNSLKELKKTQAQINQEIAQRMRSIKHKHKWVLDNNYETSYCEICGIWDR